MSTAHAAQTATNPLVLQTMLPELTAYGRGLSHPATAASQSREHGLTTTADCQTSKPPASRQSPAAARIASVPNRVEPDHGAGRFAGKRIVSI